MAEDLEGAICTLRVRDDGSFEEILFSSAIEDTPEGMFLMDRLRQDDRDFEEKLREMGGEAAIEMRHKIEDKLEHAILFGEG